MEVILLEKIKHLGNLGDKVIVKPGYGRNYLIPQKKAVPATPQKIAEFEERRAEYERAQQNALASAQDRASQLQDLGNVKIARKVGVEGKLFGSVSAADIAQAIHDESGGMEIFKHEIRLPDGPIRQVGEYEINVHLHSDIDITVTISVVAEE